MLRTRDERKNHNVNFCLCNEVFVTRIFCYCIRNLILQNFFLGEIYKRIADLTFRPSTYEFIITVAIKNKILFNVLKIRNPETKISNFVYFSNK